MDWLNIFDFDNIIKWTPLQQGYVIANYIRYYEKYLWINVLFVGPYIT